MYESGSWGDVKTSYEHQEVFFDNVFTMFLYFVSTDRWLHLRDEHGSTDAGGLGWIRSCRWFCANYVRVACKYLLPMQWTNCAECRKLSWYQLCCHWWHHNLSWWQPGIRANARLAPSQWETSLQSNTVLSLAGHKPRFSLARGDSNEGKVVILTVVNFQCDCSMFKSDYNDVFKIEIG